MKFYVSAIVGVIIRVILQNARCNNKDACILLITHPEIVEGRQCDSLPGDVL